MKKSLLILGLAVVAVTANANLVTNGSFELGSYTNSGGGFMQGVSGGSTITGWNITPDVDWIDSYWAASDGSKSIDLSGSIGAAGSMSQTLTLTPGYLYTVSFDFSGNPDGGGGVRTANVNLINADTMAQFSTSSISYDTVAMGNTASNMMWQTGTFSFVAPAVNVELSFAGVDTSGYGIALDNVRVVEAVPEPASMAALGLGVLGMLRKRKAK